MTDQQNPDVEALRAALKTACDTLEEFSGADSVLVSPERLRQTREAIGALQVLWQAALRPSPSREEALRENLRRVTDHLDTWAADHAEDRTTETDAAIYCAREALALRPASSGGASEADAARYQYLRDHCSSHHPMTWEQPAEWSIGWEFQQSTPDERFGSFDNWIDADIARQAQLDAEDDEDAPPADPVRA